MPRIASLENLHEAFLRAARGKVSKKTVQDFRADLDANLARMSRQLQTGTFTFGQYHFFTIYDPKQRTICAASFPERVAFHAIMRVCHYIFDDYQTNDSFASRKGRGQYAALERAQQLTRQYRWFAKLDVKKYFDSISHEVLFRQLARLIKDPRLLAYFHDLIGGYEASAGRGLPIGNLTSQYFANHYLAVADHYAKEHLHVPAMVRYMDDILFFDNDKAQLLSNVQRFYAYLQESLRLEMHPAIVNQTRMGIPFLGYIVRPTMLRLNQRSRKRFVRKLSTLTLALEKDAISERTYADRATCLFAFANKADIRYLKAKLTHTNGMYPQGL